MDTQDEVTTDGIWSITELEETARDMIDVGVWETAEEEERACLEFTQVSEANFIEENDQRLL